MKLTRKSDNEFYLQKNPDSICESFTITYIHDGTCVMSGDFGVLSWKRECFPKELDYGFPRTGTSKSYFVEKICEHNFPPKLTDKETGTYHKHFNYVFDLLLEAGDLIFKEVRKR